MDIHGVLEADVAPVINTVTGDFQTVTMVYVVHGFDVAETFLKSLVICLHHIGEQI